MKKTVILFAVIMTIVSILVAQTRPSAAKQRAKLIAECIDYLGTPYAYGGIDKDGIDCSGLIYVTFHDAVKIQLPRRAQAICTRSAALKDEDRQPGDLLFFRTDDDPLVCHVAVYTGNDNFIHCASSGPRTGVIVSSLNEAYWNRNYLSSGRILPVADAKELEEELGKSKINPVKLTPSQKNINADKADLKSQTETTSELLPLQTEDTEVQDELSIKNTPEVY